MKPARRRWLLVVFAVSFCLPWSSVADARGLLARPRAYGRLSRTRRQRAAVDCTVKQLLAAAKQKLDNDEPAAAEKQYSAVLRLEPCNVEALVGHGTALRRLNKLDAAMADFQAALRLNPRNADALSGRGAVSARQGDFRRALLDCDKAILLDPKNDDLYSYRGYVHSAHKEYDKAIRDFNHALALNPKAEWAWIGRGSARAEIRQFDEAIADLSEGIRLKPRNATGYRSRSTVWYQRKEFTKAVADVSEAIRLEPKESSHYMARADDYSQLNDFDCAIADCTTAIRLDKRCAEAFYDRAYYYKTKGDLNDALSDVSESIRLDPKLAKSHGGRADIYCDRGEFDKALADADAAVNLEPDDAQWYGFRGSVYEKKSDQFQANRDYDRWRQLRLAALLRELDLPPASKQPKAVADALEKRIREQVKSLEYSDDVAQGVVTLVRVWNLVTLAQQLYKAHEGQSHGGLSTDQLAKVEQKVAEQIARMINAAILYDKEKQSSHELTGIVSNRRGCCQGMGMLYFVLGRALGLHVEGLFVEVVADGHSPDGSTHVACLVTLSDGDAIMVDPTAALGSQALVSKAFRFDAVFRRLGDYWEIKDRSNPLGLHQLIQREDTSGLIAILYDSRAADQAERGNLAEAARCCADAIRRSPTYAGGYSLRGSVLAEAGKFDQAVADFSTAISHDPAYATAYAKRGDCYATSGKLNQARDDYRKALELNPKLTAIPLRLSAVYCLQNECDKAIVEFTKAIGADPKAPINYVGRAFAWSKKAESDASAAEYYKRLACAQPNNAVTANAGANYAAPSWSGPAAQQNAARDAFSTATLMRPSASPVFDPNASPNQLSSSAKSQNSPLDFSSASAVSQGESGRGAFDFSDNKRINEEEARRLMKAHEEDTAKAVADYREAIRLDPKYVDAYQYRARFYAATNRFNQAIADFTEAIRLDGKNAALRKDRSTIYAQIGDYDNAIADLTEIIRLEPKTVENYTARAALYAKKHDTDKAAADFAEAERLKPSDNRYR